MSFEKLIGHISERVKVNEDEEHTILLGIAEEIIKEVASRTKAVLITKVTKGSHRVGFETQSYSGYGDALSYTYGERLEFSVWERRTGKEPNYTSSELTLEEVQASKEKIITDMVTVLDKGEEKWS